MGSSPIGRAKISWYYYNMNFEKADSRIIHFFRKISIPVARFGLFLVFFWFGALKVVGFSPAGPMVQTLFEQTIPIMAFSTFIVCFGLFEMLIGVLFLIKGTERVVIPLLFIHMITTIMPLFVMQSETWSQFLVPTLEGQYIIKNILIIAAAICIAAQLHPLGQKRG